MRNNKKQKALFLLTFLFSVPTFAQSFWNNTYLTGGIALSEQDRRLFYFPGAAGVLEREDSKLDYEYNFSLQKKIINSNLFRLGIGIGYSAYNTTFSRPFAHAALNGGISKEGRHIKRYTINKIIFPLSGSLFITKNQNAFINFNIVPAISFRKSAKDITLEKRETKWELEANSLELYPGAGVKLNARMWLTAHYRWIYIYKLDEVIFNEALFYQRDPEFLRKEYDTYNPFKMWVTVSYALGNK